MRERADLAEVLILAFVLGAAGVAVTCLPGSPPPEEPRPGRTADEEPEHLGYPLPRGPESTLSVEPTSPELVFGDELVPEPLFLIEPRGGPSIYDCDRYVVTRRGKVLWAIHNSYVCEGHAEDVEECSHGD